MLALLHTPGLPSLSFLLFPWPPSFPLGLPVSSLEFIQATDENKLKLIYGVAVCSPLPLLLMQVLLARLPHHLGLVVREPTSQGLHP